ncbi:CocE/NonD family hydrolase [Paracrocinitomix mangrovi]|uniref:CocE/NonD family hydrolase n=1 Tax=Paracrocinitomix mangrovi TaxID=2862509 RepID=UPI001C8E3370|nr:CocE/NonD family hydrolase [Paracrocinitomix mangrovi]UKN02499.1 CocE/NonD family hydrolase [Paracrocinitomix mangrovi]
MKNLRLLFLAPLWTILVFIGNSCSSESENSSYKTFTKEDYSKKEVYIEMRDGAKLFTTIYSPKDKDQDYPVIIKRTPYSCNPYGADTMPEKISHNPKLVESGYIFVVQDVRGRWNSEGVFENVKPPYSLWDSTATDELTDSYDTYDWLVENLENFNGNIGQYGNSYPGWTTLIGARTNHPNLKAVMAMAPVTNFFYEDFYRYGLCGMNYIPVMNAFGTYKDEPTTESWYDMKDSIYGLDQVEEGESVPYYEFFRERLALTNFEDIMGDNFFWKEIKAHPNYDEYQDKRNWLNYIKEPMSPQIMIVGGWHDEQNLFGILNSYKSLVESNPDAQLVVGPWSHGHNKNRDSLYCLGDICFGTDISKNFQEGIEFDYWEYHLKGKGEAPNFSVRLFDTGILVWKEFEEFPPTSNEEITYFLSNDGSLSSELTHQEGFKEFVSDPLNPVPFLEEDNFYRMAPKSYMTADQRFLANRKDVLSFTSDVLEEDLTVNGEVKALINFASSMEDADVYVKLIDVYPDVRSNKEHDLEDVDYSGYQRLIRLGYIRARFRNGFVTPERLVAGEKTSIQVPLLEVFHTFKKGHRIMIQVQSSMFPLFDMNPQNWKDNIFEATKEDFKSSVHKVYNDSKIILPINN